MLTLLGTCFSAGQTLPLGKWLFLVWLFKLFVGAFVTSLDWAFFDSGAVLQYCILDGALRLCPPFHHSEDYARRRRSFWFKNRRNRKNRESSSVSDVSDVYKIGRWLRDLRRPSGGGSDGSHLSNIHENPWSCEEVCSDITAKHTLAGALQWI